MVPGQLGIELDEFGKFMSQGNIADRFVAIGVAAAFIEASDSLVKGMFLPVIELLVPRALQERKFWVLRSGDSGGPYSTVDDAKADGALVVTYGRVIRATLVFLLQAVILFVIFRVLSKLKHLPGAAGAVGAKLNAALPTSRA